MKRKSIRRDKEFTASDALAIVDAHEIDTLIENEEEKDLLLSNNPELYHAYERLVFLSQT